MKKYTLNNKYKVVITVFVLAAVGLNILSAITLKTIASQINPHLSFLLAGIGIVVLLNATRMLVWYLANKRYPLSTIYPLTSIFYPIMLIVSFFYGEPITSFQIIGTGMITAGVFWLSWRIEDNE